MPDRDRPSRHGQALGRMLARWAEAGPYAKERCRGCAFREGAMANKMASTGREAMDCVLRGEMFGCHHGLEDGLPTRMCAGYASALHVGSDTIRADLIALKDEFAAMHGPDEVRSKFDEWIAGVDPEGQLNDYERAKLWGESQCRPCDSSSS